jgi:hypothetical protein
MSEQSRTGEKHRLRIIFDGVIAVGPPHPKSGDEQGPLFGVMARSTRRETERSKKKNAGPRTFIPMHVPTLFTKLAPCGEDARRPDEIFQLLPEHPIWNLWHPIRERMCFKFDGDGEPGKLTYQRESSVPDTGQERHKYKKLHFDKVFNDKFGPAGLEGKLKLRSIKDLPDAREIWPARCHLLPGLLDPNPIELVAAQVFVPRGHVGGGGVGKKGEGLDVVFDPDKPGSRKKKKSIVPNVVVTVEVETVEIEMQSLDTGETLDSLRFHLTEDAEIWISNGDPSDVAINVRRQALRMSEAERATAHDRIFGLKAFKKLAGDVVKEEIAKFILHTDNITSLLVPEEMQQADRNRISDFDIDFELFYTLMDGEDDHNGLPLPRRADYKKFDTGNCYCKLVCRPEEHR